MQVYREARILTARPDDAALARAPHLLYGHVGVDETYSVARFQSDAAAALAAVTAGGRKPIFTGGSGLYFAALTEGLADIPRFRRRCGRGCARVAMRWARTHCSRNSRARSRQRVAASPVGPAACAAGL